MSGGHAIEIRTVEGGYDSNYGYAAHLAGENRAVIIDAALPPDLLLAGLRLDPVALLITHTHADHIAYLPQWLHRYPSLQIYGIDHPLRDDLPHYNGLPHGSIIDMAGLRIEMIATPGHYADSVCWNILGHNALFTGDTLFVGRTGRTLSPQSNIADLYNSVYTRLFQLPGEIVIYPGHNYGPTPTASLDDLKMKWPFFQCQSLAEFTDVMSAFERNRNG